jgi:hypothetical protein
MSALLDPPDQLPGDADIPSADSFEAWAQDHEHEDTFAELGACERENLRLRMLVSSLLAEKAKTVPMPPEPSDIDW